MRVGVTDTQPVEGVNIDPDSYTVCGDVAGKQEGGIRGEGGGRGGGRWRGRVIKV